MTRAHLFAIGGVATVILAVLAVRSVVSPSARPRTTAAAAPSVEPESSAEAFADEPSPPSEQAPHDRKHIAKPTSDDGDEPRERYPADAGPPTPEALLAALDSSNPFEAVDAADELAERKLTQAIPKLMATDLRKAPESAPAFIHALGALAGAVNGAERRNAADRLVTWLKQERSRNAAESPGNVLTIYEALGDAKEASSAAALERELLDPAVTGAEKSVIVASLVQIHASSSAGALRTLLGTLQTPLSDEWEEDVRKELIATVEAAIRSF